MTGGEHTTGTGDACAHAVDHFNHVVSQAAHTWGQAVDGFFGHHQHVTPGQVVEAYVDTRGAQQAMEAACDNNSNNSGGGWGSTSE